MVKSNGELGRGKLPESNNSGVGVSEGRICVGNTSCCWSIVGIYVGVGGSGWKGVGVNVAPSGAFISMCFSLLFPPGATKTADSAAMPEEQAEPINTMNIMVRILINDLLIKCLDRSIYSSGGEVRGEIGNP